MQGLGQGGRQARFALLIREAWVGGAQLQVGHQAVELPVAAGDDHEGAFLDFLRRHNQPGPQGFLQSAPDDVTDCRFLIFDFRLLIVHAALAISIDD